MATRILPPPGTCRGGTATGCPSARPSRREMLSAAGFTVLSGIAAVSMAKPDPEAAKMLPTRTGQDAELIAIADRFMALQARVDSVDAREWDATDSELSDIVCEQADLLEEMHPLVITTPQRHRTRARVFVAWYGMEGGKESPSVIDHDRLWPILRDLLGEAV